MTFLLILIYGSLGVGIDHVPMSSLEVCQAAKSSLDSNVTNATIPDIQSMCVTTQVRSHSHNTNPQGGITTPDSFPQT